MPGIGLRKLALATMTRSMSPVAMPLAAMALPPAATAISTRGSSSLAQRRSAMPTRVWIHSSLVSITWARSAFVTRLRGQAGDRVSSIHEVALVAEPLGEYPVIGCRDVHFLPAAADPAEGGARGQPGAFGQVG